MGAGEEAEVAAAGFMACGEEVVGQNLFTASSLAGRRDNPPQIGGSSRVGGTGTADTISAATPRRVSLNALEDRPTPRGGRLNSSQDEKVR